VEILGESFLMLRKGNPNYQITGSIIDVRVPRYNNISVDR